MKSSRKKAAKKTATRKAVAKAPAKKKAAARKTGKTVAKASAKTARPGAPAKKAARKTMNPSTARKAAPVKKQARPMPATAARKAAPAKKAMRPIPRTTPAMERAKPMAQPQAGLRDQQSSPENARPQEERDMHMPEQQRPDATYDPTPDTQVPLRGHTSFQHNAQSERAAALKGQRARIANRGKY